MVLFNKQNSHDCNNLFWVEAVEVGVRREEEGKIACHPPLQVTTEGTRGKENLSESGGSCQTWSSRNNVDSVTNE